MSTDNKADHVLSTLNKLDSLIGKNKKKGRVDFKELNELRKKAFLKLKEGKNSVAFVRPDEKSEDPFFVWGYHNSLQEVAYYSVPCNKFNKNENCVICNVIESLQEEDREKNKSIWFPIRQQTEIYAPVVDLDNESEGLKWLRISKTIVSQLTEWLRNLEATEEPFYSDNEPQKVIISYDKSEQPMSQYKLVNKNMKAFTAQQLADWRGNLKPVADYIFGKKEDELKTLVDEYFERVSNEIGTATTNAEQEKEQVASVESKLASLKKVD